MPIFAISPSTTQSCTPAPQVGDKRSHLPHIPSHLPPFPDTHTYHFTPTVKQPVTEYEAIREKAATQKSDVEKALCKFETKTNPVDTLFFTPDKDFLRE